MNKKQGDLSLVSHLLDYESLSFTHYWFPHSIDFAANTPRFMSRLSTL